MTTRATEARRKACAYLNIRLEQSAREQRQREIAGTRPTLWRRFAKFIRKSFGV